MTEPPSAYVLSGGKSRRFGSDKARAELDGLPLIVRVAAVLRAAFGEVVVVADRPGKYADLGLPTIADRRPDCGPAAGLETALADRLERRGPGWIVLASCDLATLKPEWTMMLSAPLPGPAADAVAFRAGFWEPFPGAYRTTLLPSVAARLDAGSSSFQALLSDPGVTAVALPRPADWPTVSQVNTLADLEALRAADG